MESFNTFLQNFPNYKPSVFEKAYPFLSKRTIQSGEYFLPHGKVSRNIAFIKKGLLRLFYLNDGKEIIYCFCRENNITTSYKSLITQQESEIAIQAIEETELIVLPYESLQNLYSKDPFWQQVGRLASESEFLRNETHNRFLRDYSATERYLQILENDNELLQRVPLNHLASYLQITPETLSRIRKKITRT